MIKLPDKETFTPVEVANIFKFSLMTIYRMVRSGELKAIKPTGKRAMRIERGSVEKIARRYVN